MSAERGPITKLRLERGRELVEPFNWNQFQFKMVTEADYDKVLDHLHKNFFLSTPLTKGLAYSQEYFDEFDKVYLETLPQNLSFYALDTTTNEIAAMRIIYIQDRALEKKFASFGYKTSQMEIMNLVMGTVNNNADIYGHYGITEYVNFYTACVDPKYRGQGLATHMYEKAFKFIRSFPEFKIVKSNLTSPYTRRICENFEFKELARVYYNDFRDENGTPLLNGANDDEFVAFMAREI